MKKEFKALNIKCGGCAKTVSDALKKDFGVVEVDLEKEPRVVSVEIKDEEHEKLFRKKMRGLGYPMDDEELGAFTATGLKAKSFLSCAVGKMS